MAPETPTRPARGIPVLSDKQIVRYAATAYGPRLAATLASLFANKPYTHFAGSVRRSFQREMDADRASRAKRGGATS